MAFMPPKVPKPGPGPEQRQINQPSFGFDMSFLSGLWDRWQPAWDIAVQRMSDQTVRDRDAYIQWKESKDLQQKLMSLQADQAARALSQERWDRQAAAQAQQQQQLLAQQKEQQRIQDLARNAQSKGSLISLGGDKAASALADESQYGASSPQGRGGGGNAPPAKPVMSDSDKWKLDACRKNPNGPGCPALLSQAMATGLLSEFS